MPSRFDKPDGGVNPTVALFTGAHNSDAPMPNPWPGCHRGGVCPRCRDEMLDRRSRRYRDPFISCNECGPGVAITARLPFSRENTSFAPFEPCEACRAEFGNPASPQYGSPTVSCPHCGPQYWIEPTPTLREPGDVIHEAARLLESGAILGLKDTRAFRLLARADDDALVRRLRRRQAWEDVPLGVMVRDLAMAESIVVLDETARALLQAPSSPRLILPLREGAALSDQVAARSREIAVMLPPEAVHHLLFTEIDVPLLAAPAIPGDDVAVRGNEDARLLLMDVVDHLVLHDLDLYPCTEDAVMRVVAGEPVVLRRAGADTDCPLALPAGSPEVLGLGSSTDATAAAAHGPCVRLGPYVGDLRSERAVAMYRRSTRRLLEIWSCTPEFVAYDPEGGGPTLEMLEEFEVERVPVDHHHAHVACAMAEHRHAGPAVGVSLDGPVPHVESRLSRGVFLVGDAAGMDVVDTVPSFRVPAGDVSARDAWRMAMGLLHDLVSPEVAEDWVCSTGRGDAAVRSAMAMLSHDVGCSRVESFGRIFDGIGSLLGAQRTPLGESRAAVRLCDLSGPVRDLDEDELPDPGLGLRELYAQVLQEILRRRATGTEPVGATATWALTSLLRGMALRAVALCEEHGIDTVAAGGGAFADPWARHVLRRTVEARGRRVLLNAVVPCGDAGLALGQVWAVAHGARRAG